MGIKQSRQNDRTRDNIAERKNDRGSAKVFPFGKHKGRLLAEIPSNYLDWVIENFDDGEWRDLAVAEIRLRDDSGAPVVKAKKQAKPKKPRMGTNNCSVPESTLVPFTMPTGKVTHIPDGWQPETLPAVAPF